MMADPNSKRAKLDNSNIQSSSTSLQNAEIHVKLINTDTQSFEDIRKMPGFVDHTNFLKIFIEDETALAIFAPHRFGKSSHLDMVRKFLEIDVDEETGEVCSSVNGPAEKRKNYKLFEGTRIIKNKDLVEQHLGKHPVIHLDFKGASVSSVKDAKDFCRKVMHDAYLDHPYLKTSTKLYLGEEGNASCQNICKKWCDDELYMTPDLRDSLENLTRYLYNHFDRTKVYILVDEFDAINASALRNIPENIRDDKRVRELKDICEVLENIFGQVAKGNWSEDHVAGLIFTGISSYISSILYSSSFNNFTIRKFLDEDFVPFYGVTKREVKNLIEKLVNDKALKSFEGKAEFLNASNELDVEKIMDDVQSHYDGYYFEEKGTQIFCLWSVLQYLERGTVDSYWNPTDGIDDLYNILKCDYVASEVMKLMRGDMIDFRRHYIITLIEDLVELHDLIVVRNKNTVHSEIVFSFLMDQGYLTYTETGGQNERFQKFKIPNGEIRQKFSEMIGNIVLKHWKITKTIIETCTSLIDEISLSLIKDEETLQIKMRKVYQAISSILKELGTKCEHLHESIISCIMFKVLNDAKSFHLCTDLSIELSIKDEVSNSITPHRPDILMHKNDDKCSILWELKYNKDYKDKRSTSLHALQEARGLVPFTYNEFKNYINPLEELGRKVLVIGLSMDSSTEVSLSYAVGMEQKIFYESEKEPNIFSDFYQTHNAMPLQQEENDD